MTRLIRPPNLGDGLAVQGRVGGDDAGPEAERARQVNDGSGGCGGCQPAHGGHVVVGQRRRM
jgi:hypothetical protein